MILPKEKIEEIKSSVDIVDFIAQYVPLKKAGSNYKGLCPFHNEKTPSFTVSGAKQIFHCFGCHKGGNVFNFLMEYKRISFPEAVKEVAEYCGIALETRGGDYSAAKDLTEKLYAINNIAQEYFVESLWDATAGKKARAYLQERNVKESVQKIFSLGYARDSYSSLKNYLELREVDLEMAKDLGLLNRKERGTYYDKFRDRIIFPIFSTNGRIVGFGGRTLSGEKETAKYLNSNESKIYSKRKILYGLYHSKEEIVKEDRAILVEGYMDLISLYQSGIKNVVASSGTALTDEQVKLLSRFTKNIVVLFDADTAGEKAVLRSIELLLKNDFEIKVLTLPQGEDPDSFVNKFGAGAFKEELKRSKNYLEYLTSSFQEKGMLDDPGEMTNAIRELIKSAALIQDELKRSLHLKNVSQKFNIRLNLLERELENYLRKSDGKRLNRRRTGESIGRVNSRQSAKSNLSGGAFEREVIRLLFDGSEEIMGLVLDNIPPEALKNKELREIALSVHESYREDVIQPDELIERLPKDSLKEIVRVLLLNEEAISQKWSEISNGASEYQSKIKFVEDLVRKYKLELIEEEIKKIQKEISETEDDQTLISLLNEVEELKNHKKELANNKAF